MKKYRWFWSLTGLFGLSLATGLESCSIIVAATPPTITLSLPPLPTEIGPLIANRAIWTIGGSLSPTRTYEEATLGQRQITVQVTQLSSHGGYLWCETRIGNQILGRLGLVLTMEELASLSARSILHQPTVAEGRAADFLAATAAIDAAKAQTFNLARLRLAFAERLGSNAWMADLEPAIAAWRTGSFRSDSARLPALVKPSLTPAVWTVLARALPSTCLFGPSPADATSLSIRQGTWTLWDPEDNQTIVIEATATGATQVLFTLGFPGYTD